MAFGQGTESRKIGHTDHSLSVWQGIKKATHRFGPLAHGNWWGTGRNQPGCIQPLRLHGSDEPDPAVGTTGVTGGVATDKSDARQALSHEVLYHAAHGACIGKSDDMADGVFGQIPGLDNGDACVLEHPPGARGMAAAGHDDGLGAATEELRDQAFLFGHVIVGVAQQNLQPALLKPLGQPAHGFGEVRVVDGRDGDGDEIRLLRAEVRGRAVKDIANVVSGFQDGVARRLADRAVGLESPADRHWRDPGNPGDICHCR